ncbi:helix-turn-helix domain-containing protein [Fibrobacterota bacterium]
MKKPVKYKDLLKNELKNKRFRIEYENLEEEFTFAKEIIKLRLKSGLTQKQLAEKAKTSQPAIARLESGSYKNVSMAVLRKIGEALGAVPVLKFKKVAV